MRKRQRGSRDRYVKKYPRWVRGDRRRVKAHLKGGDLPKAKQRDDDTQLKLDL